MTMTPAEIKALVDVPSRTDALRVGRAILQAHGQWENENQHRGAQVPWDEPHVLLLGQAALLEATALRSFMDGGWRLVPVKPTDGLLMSMAMRWDHGLGCPGYYDQPFFSGQPSHAQRLRVALSSMRQLHEEVVGSGFYSADREGFYLERLPAPPEGEAGE